MEGLEPRLYYTCTSFHVRAFLLQISKILARRLIVYIDALDRRSARPITAPFHARITSSLLFFPTVSPNSIDYAHMGPAFFTWHRWFHVFFETEVQAMLQAMGRGDYHKFRFPYWDWRGEIQRSYGLPSEKLFTFDRFGEIRNISNHAVVFGDMLGDDWTTICLDNFYALCDPNNSTGSLQRCPFTGDPNLCHSSNPDWPTMQDVNDLIEFYEYETPPFNYLATNSVRPDADYISVSSIEECREDLYCQCVPGGAQCLDDSPEIIVTAGVHTMVRT